MLAWEMMSAADIASDPELSPTQIRALQGWRPAIGDSPQEAH